MIINLSPQRSDKELLIIKSGDLLIVNGVELDFSLLEEGSLLPREAIDCPELISDVERIDGHVTLTFILPHGVSASGEARFPTPIVDPPDGEVVLPS